MDYQGNANKDKEPKEPKPAKQIEKVVTGEVTQKPKSIGKKFKGIFFGGEFKAAAKFVAADVILPAFRDLLVDAISFGVKRMVYGDSMNRRRTNEYRPTVSYNNPVNRTMSYDPRTRARLPDQPHPARQQRREHNDIILADRADAENVVEMLIEIVNTYDEATVADLYDLLGWTSSHVDQKWGWTRLPKVAIIQVREGYLIDLPPQESLN